MKDEKGRALVDSSFILHPSSLKRMGTAPFAEVALPLPVDQLFTYGIPDALSDRAVPGMRAIVPFRNKFETGYIVSLSESSPVEAPRRIVDLPDHQPVFAPDMIRLCQWIADYYRCSLGEALQTAVPAGLKMRTTMRYTLTNARASEATVEVVQAGLDRWWHDTRIVQESQPSERPTADEAVWQVRVPANGSASVTATSGTA